MKKRSRTPSRSEKRFWRRFIGRRDIGESPNVELEDYLDAYIGSSEQKEKARRASASIRGIQKGGISVFMIILVTTLLALAIREDAFSIGVRYIRSFWGLADSEKLNDLLVNGPKVLPELKSNENIDVNAPPAHQLENGDSLQSAEGKFAPNDYQKSSQAPEKKSIAKKRTKNKKRGDSTLNRKTQEHPHPANTKKKIIKN